MARMIQDTSHYRPSYLANILHSFPHLNVSLHLVNNTFAPESELYLESLGILGSIPAAWLILTLFLLLIYLMTRCCDRKPRPKHSIIVLKWTLGIFAVLCCGAIGVSLYGNDDLHNGLSGFVVSAQAIDDKIMTIKNQTRMINDALNITIERSSGKLRDVFDEPVENQTALSELFTALRHFSAKKDESLKNLRDISRALQYVSLQHTINLVHLAETIRWPLTMGVLCLLLIFCIVLLFGVARHSRYALIMFSVVGLFAVIISWLLASIYLSISVAAGDFCVNPDLFVEHKAPPTLQTDILVYYISCENSLTNPFTLSIKRGTDAIDEMQKQLITISQVSKNLFAHKVHPHLEMLTKEVYGTSGMISTLATELECKFFHSKYIEILRSLCHDGLFGLMLMLLASLVSGFFFTILVWLDSHTWIYIRKKRDVNVNGAGGTGTLRPAGIHPIGTISHQRLGSDSGQYATLNRKFRTLDHPARQGRHMVSFDTASHTLGHSHNKKQQLQRGDGPGQYSTLSKKCKTLESNDFY
ncbi:protein tweety isoform X2 [Planococcus citri]|uniref:protein tweety isoform X2 n=1 Tax=Planococcus citri TaxID=170843 RepID=UPI0031F9C328